MFGSKAQKDSSNETVHIMCMYIFIYTEMSQHMADDSLMIDYD